MVEAPRGAVALEVPSGDLERTPCLDCEVRGEGGGGYNAGKAGGGGHSVDHGVLSQA